MPTKNPSNLDNKPQEKIKTRLPGFEFTSISPTSKTVIILLIILTFLLVLAVLMPKFMAVRWLTG
ncbi:MAG TPA: hypothetical protein VNS58_07250 [Puia sp.]|nr:hypothetical protein [Puia sp.]